MTEQLQLRGGSNAENNAFTGAPREVTVDTTFSQLRVHDGVNAGGTVVGGALGMQFEGEVGPGSWATLEPINPNVGDAWLVAGTITNFPGAPPDPVAGDLVVFSENGWINVGDQLMGPPGPEGPEGPEGPPGPEGPAGEGISFKGSVASVNDLPQFGNVQGDTYYVEDENRYYIWDGAEWDPGIKPDEGTVQDLQNVLEVGSVASLGATFGGDVNANKFIGDGSELTNLPVSTQPDLQSVLDAGDTTYGVGMHLQSNEPPAQGGHPYIQLTNLTTGAMTTVGGGNLQVLDNTNLATSFQVGYYAGNGHYVYNFQCGYNDASFTSDVSSEQSFIGKGLVVTDSDDVNRKFSSGNNTVWAAQVTDENATPRPTPLNQVVAGFTWDGKVTALTYDLESLDALP